MRKRGVDGFRVLQSEEKEKYQTIMLQITLDMYQTLAAAVVVLALGRFLRGRVRLLERFCIPAPVIGGVLFAIFTCVCYGTGIAEFAFDDILKEVCMVFFFTSVGFQANLKVLRSGGTEMIVFLVLVIGLIVGQNFVAIGLSKVLGISPLVGLCTGSIPMVGGHGTAGAFGPMLEGFGVRGATTLCTAAACIRNIGEYSGAYVVYMGEINDIGGISLSLFLGMAMITLKLWQLADLAGPLVVLLAGQTVFILLYVVLVVFNVMGRDYDAAVLVSGTCGFGMGATPNAMANMQVVCEKYAPSIKAYLIIPLVGSLFADFLNSLAITLFINLI